MKNIIVIGGGAAGLTAAIHAKNANTNVIILERNNKCGKKLLITGNGRCNYFNDNFNKDKYHSSSCDNLEQIINNDTKNLILKFFKSLGVVPRIKNGYYYPLSNQASSILNTLIIEAINKKVVIENNILVEDISYSSKFTIKTNEKEYESDALIICCGGLSFPKTGSDGTLLNILPKLNHSIVKPLPSLVQLKSDYKYLKDLEGVRTDVLIQYDSYIENGELQFTKYGISGICVMQLSNYIVSDLEKQKNVNISINYLPQIDNVKKMLFTLNNNTNNRTIGNILDQLLNYKLVNVLLKEVNIKYDSYLSNLSDDKIDKLVKILTCHNILINGTNTFNEAQTTKGGISLKEIDLNTFASKKIKNLYFAGEILDINGDCGGYNLSFAWLSGIISGMSASKYD